MELLIKKFVKNYEDVENPTVRAAYGKFAGAMGIFLNVILFTMKLTIGIISSSVSITADAVNNLSDASSSIISLLGFKLAEKPADKEHPYGHGRYEYLSGLTVAVLIILIGFEILKSSINKILHPEAVEFSPVLVAILLISVLVKLWMMVFNKKMGKRINSNTLIATSEDSRNDVISTSAVLVTCIISHMTALELDGYVGLVVAIFILISGAGLIKDTIDPMLGIAPDPEFVIAIRNRIMTYPGILGMHDLLIHDYGPCRKFASVHVEIAAEADVIESHDVIDNIEQDLFENMGLHMIVHYDPILTQDNITGNIRKQVETAVKSINPILSIHDLRVVPGTTHTNLVFDCEAEYDVHMTDEELKNAIVEKVREIKPDYNCVITIDRSFSPIPHR